MNAPNERQRPRIREIDGLRGIAAMGVVLCHFQGELETSFARLLPRWVGDTLALGYLGVTIFFVLSGFVIALSIGTPQISSRLFWRFALRRSIRLDPPYWMSIVVVVAFLLLKQKLFPDIETQIPRPEVVAAHVLYLQNILGFSDILPIYWTLCFEVQFYVLLLFVLLTLQHSLSVRNVAEVLRSPFSQFVLTSFIGLSAMSHCKILPGMPSALAASYWFCFGLGALTFWVYAGLVSRVWLLVANLCVAAAFAASGCNRFTAPVAVLTSALVLFVANRPMRLGLLTGRAIQFLGRISYSLYLFHGVVGWSVVSLFVRLVPSSGSSAVFTLFIFATGVLVSVFAGWVAYLAIERPSVRLSRRVTM